MTILSFRELKSILEKELVISAKDASTVLGDRKRVYALQDKGDLKRCGTGLYTLPGIEEGTAQFAALNKYFPKCVVSGVTALSLCGLGQEYLDKIHVDIPNTTNLSNSLLEVHRVTAKRISHVENRKFEEKGIPFKIKVYSPERTLFEAYKYYGVGTDAFIRAIKNYRNLYLNKKSPGKQYDVILSIDKEVGRELVNFLSMGDING